MSQLSSLKTILRHRLILPLILSAALLLIFLLLPDGMPKAALEVLFAWPLLLLCAFTASRSQFLTSKQLGLLIPLYAASYLILPSLLPYFTAEDLLVLLRDLCFYLSLQLSFLVLATLLILLTRRLTRPLAGKKPAFLGLVARITAVLSFPLLTLPALIPTGYLLAWSLCGTLLSDFDLMALSQSYAAEILDFIRDHLRRPLPLATTLLLLVLFTYALAGICRRLPAVKMAPNFLFTLTCSLAVLLCATSGLYLLTPYYSFALCVNEYNLFRTGAEDRARIFEAQKQQRGVPASLEKGTYVLVIGESESRDAMQAFGFTEADDTPWMSEMQQRYGYSAEGTQPNGSAAAVWLNQGYSCHTQTVENLTYALTSFNQYSTIRTLSNSPSLIELLRHRYGFGTAWLSNQMKIGRFDSPIGALASQSGISYFTHKVGEALPDGVLLEVLPHITVSGASNLIVIHLMGSHYPYDKRYPESFTHYRSPEGPDYASYLNSVLYTDTVLKEITAWAHSLPDFKAFMYFSDHGEDLWTGRRHEYSLAGWDMTHIPFFALFSPSYLQDHPERVRALSSHRDTPFTNDLLFDTLLGLIGATDNEYYASTFDLSSPDYAGSREVLKTMHGRQHLSQETAFCTPHCDKIWLHRADDPQKIKELGSRYPGIELDLHYHQDLGLIENTHYDDPFHPPVQNPQGHNLNASLSALEPLFAPSRAKPDACLPPQATFPGAPSYCPLKAPTLWLDFKNLTPENAAPALELLKKHLLTHHLPLSAVFIEHPNFEVLKIVHEHGLKAVLWLPYFRLDTLSTDDVQSIAAQAHALAASGVIAGFSFAGEYYDFVKALDLPVDFPLYTWFLNIHTPFFPNHPRAAAILSDPAVKAVLLEHYGHYHR